MKGVDGWGSQEGPAAPPVRAMEQGTGIRNQDHAGRPIPWITRQ